MSNEAVKWAMDDAPMLLTDKGRPDTTARHVLQALAEHAHKDGTNAHPSVRRLQYRTGYDERTVRRALRRLEGGNLIKADGTVRSCTRWTLALHLVRPESDWTDLEVAEELFRAAAAERKRRSRAKAVTHSASVTVTHSDDVTGEMSHTLRPAVTHSECVTEGDVTHSASGRHALSAPRTIRNHPTTEPSGNHHYPAPAQNLPVLWEPAAVAAVVEEPAGPSWLQQLQTAMSASGINIPWRFDGDEQLLVENDVRRLGLQLMVRIAVDSAAGAQRGPFSSRFFYPAWRRTPTPVDQNVTPIQPKSRQQQDTDAHFDRFAARARARAQQRKEIS
ncbi:MAG: helix-turn-helix domain-containing protein [Streptomyces sp.]|nr:helix-turn-helix domain-containing protein [Streptomyces sp.]NUS24381.1 helix-turn-helix domain-containing protein [Streptomyces sp.]